MFIVLEGIDGSGTTTQTARLADALRRRGHRCYETCEPSDRPIGRLIRQALQGHAQLPDGRPWDPTSLALLFAADRIDHLRAEVEPHMADGHIVISDRYVHSSLAYQGTTLDMRWIDAINAQARRADLVIWLDVPVSTCMARVSARGEARELYERADVLHGVAAAYERAMTLRPERVVRVDGVGDLDEVGDRVLQAVCAHLFPDESY